jgi:hypothetical protein
MRIFIIFSGGPVRLCPSIIDAVIGDEGAKKTYLCELSPIEPVFLALNDENR